MKLRDILDIQYNIPQGFRVAFEWYGDGFLRADFYPEKGESLIPFEEEAWKVAEILAKILKGKCCNFYVAKEDLTPVEGYMDREIINR